MAYVEEEKGRPSFRYIETCLNALESTRRQVLEDGTALYQYHNVDTDAACDFVLSTQGKDKPPTLTCELTLPRPTTFALECLPLAVRVARDLKMLVEVISPPYDESPFVPTVEDLIARWQRANLEERQLQELQGRKFYVLPSTDLEAIWEYSLLRRDMARRYNRTRVQVPPLIFWGDKKSHRGLRVATWPNLGAVAFPISDLVRLETPPAPLKDGAVYETSQVIAAAGSLFKSLAMPVQHYFFDKEGYRKDLVEIMRGLPRVDTSSFVKLTHGDVLDEDASPWE